MSDTADSIVVGAGITGLTAAYSRKQRGERVLLLESNKRLGGVIQSERCEGFLIENGPSTLLGRPAVLQLLEQLGISPQLPSAAARKRFLGERTPDGIRLFSPRSLLYPNSIISLRGRARALLEPFIPRGSAEDESVEDFLARRFGREIAERLVAPALSGIYACDISRLSARSSLRALWALEQKPGSILRGFIAKLIWDRSPRVRSLSFPGGLSDLVERLGAELPPECVRCSTPVESLARSDTGFQISTPNGNFSSHEVTLALPAGVTADLLAPLDSDPRTANLVAALRAIPYAPLGIVHLAYPRAALTRYEPAFGSLFIPQTGHALLGALNLSALYPERAPQGWALFSCFLGGMKNPELSNPEKPGVLKQVTSELSQVLGASAAPKIIQTHYLPHAIPNYAVGHHRIEDPLRDFEQRYPGLKLLGNWRMGVSLAACIENALR